MILFTHNVENIKHAAHRNSDVDGIRVRKLKEGSSVEEISITVKTFIQDIRSQCE